MSMMKTFVLGLAGAATAHMVMREPVPFANSIGGFGLQDPENSPLNEDGSNYPCHMVGPYDASQSTTYELGSTQTLAFMGSAVHGGGSCQISLTYDESPTKQSVFKVIHSIEGGCPAKNTPGNFPADPKFLAPDTYDFKVPDNIPAGKVVLAMTWFNRVGNREMYMNCAPVELTGSGGDISNFNALPDIMVANIGEKKCTVAEGTDVKFPNAGSSVDQFPFSGEFQDVSSQEACSYNWMAGDGPGSAQPPAGGDNGSGGSPDDDADGNPGDGSNGNPGDGSNGNPGDGSNGNPGDGSNGNPGDGSNGNPGEGSNGAPGGGDSSGRPGGRPNNGRPNNGPNDDVPSPVPGGAFVEVPPTPVPAPEESNPNPVGDGNNGGDDNDNVGGPGSEGGASACSPEGAYNCLGDGFQQCANGVWTVVRPMAQGTSCTPGQAMSLDVVVTKAKLARAFRA